MDCIFRPTVRMNIRHIIVLSVYIFCRATDKYSRIHPVNFKLVSKAALLLLFS